MLPIATEVCVAFERLQCAQHEPKFGLILERLWAKLILEVRCRIGGLVTLSHKPKVTQPCVRAGTSTICFHIWAFWVPPHPHHSCQYPLSSSWYYRDPCTPALGISPRSF